MPVTELPPSGFFGEVTTRFEADGTSVALVRHPVRRLVPRHAHPEPYICVLVSGAYRETVERRTLEYEPFSVVLHAEPPVHDGDVGIDGGLLLSVATRAEMRGAEAPRVLGGTVSAAAARLYAVLLRGISPMATEELALDLASHALRERFTRETSSPGWLRRCLERVHAEFASRPTIADLAKEAGVHPVHLSRTFRRRYGRTVGEYLNELRVSYACASLAKGRQSLSDLALDLGFADQSHFTRAFGAVVGCSPGSFRTATRGS
jgi:AraC family transcriptional regulator